MCTCIKKHKCTEKPLTHVRTQSLFGIILKQMEVFTRHVVIDTLLTYRQRILFLMKYGLKIMKRNQLFNACYRRIRNNGVKGNNNEKDDNII